MKDTIRNLLAELKKACNEEHMDYIFAIVDKDDKSASVLWCSVPTQSPMGKANEILSDYFAD